MDKITLQQLTILAVEEKIETLRFGSDGRTAIIKYYPSGPNQILTEKRITPIKDSDGVDRYDVSFLNLSQERS